MTKRKTIVHFLTAIPLVILGLNMFKIASGEISFDLHILEDGARDMTAPQSIVLPLMIAILGFAGLITILNYGEFLDWAKAAGVILLIGGIGCFTLYNVAIFLLAGLYCLWWGIASVKGLFQTLSDQEGWEGLVMAIFRIVMAVMFFMVFMVGINTPGMYFPESGSLTEGLANWSTWAGIFCFASAVGLVVEALIWRRVCDYY